MSQFRDSVWTNTINSVRDKKSLCVTSFSIKQDYERRMSYGEAITYLNILLIFKVASVMEWNWERYNVSAMHK